MVKSSAQSGRDTDTMSAVNCAECQHWDRENAYHSVTAIKHGWGLCVLSEEKGWQWVGWDEAQAESNDEYDGDTWDPPEDARMFAQDGSNYWAALVTHPEFSCSEFRRKSSSSAHDSSGTQT